MVDTGPGRREGTAARELSRPVAIDRLQPGASPVIVEAAEGERAAIAKRLRVPSVHALRVEWSLTRGTGGLVEATGRLDARVEQVCVVTLEPFEAPVVERFVVRFVPAALAGSGGGAEDEDPESPDEIPYEGGALDLGEASVEQLALALDPFPRKPGVVFAEASRGPADPSGGEEEAASPFAALARRFPSRQ